MRHAAAYGGSKHNCYILHNCITAAHPTRHLQADSQSVAVQYRPYQEEPVPREMTFEEIKEIQQKFVDAAIRAIKAGYDGVELHGAHSYLIGQFSARIITNELMNTEEALKTECASSMK